jgi:hypothetical protein
MIAITSCVKRLAVPGPPPGPWEARTAPVESKVAAGITPTAKGNLRRRFRDEAMTISYVETIAEDTQHRLRRFCNLSPEL